MHGESLAWMRITEQGEFCFAHAKQNSLAISAERRNSTRLMRGNKAPATHYPQSFCLRLKARFLATTKTQDTPVLHGQGEFCFAHAKQNSRYFGGTPK